MPPPIPSSVYGSPMGPPLIPSSVKLGAVDSETEEDDILVPDCVLPGVVAIVTVLLGPVRVGVAVVGLAVASFVVWLTVVVSAVLSVVPSVVI